MTRLDLTGQRYGYFTVISEAEQKGKIRYWNCLCDCGNTKMVRTGNLRSGNTISCGCSRAYDLKGKKYGLLKVLERSRKKSKNGFAYWVCECDCGEVKEFLSSALLHDGTRSCGCLVKEISKKTIKKTEQKYMVDGVYVPNLTNKVRSDNKAGVKGVSLQQRKNRDVYRAIITIKKKKIHLGYFDTIEEAVKARKLAEEKYHKPFIDKLEERDKYDFE